MGHTAYTTDGFILGGYGSGEGNKLFPIFTRQFGLVWALARSVREERSKLRYHLEHHSLVEVVLIRGRDTWRITGAETISRPYRTLPFHSRACYVRILSLLRRLLHGEEQNSRLFATMEACIEALHAISADDVRPLEHIIVLRVLHQLGYMGAHSLEKFVNEPITPELVAAATLARGEIAREINRAFEESQL
jgi:DNA repair protein RecO